MKLFASLSAVLLSGVIHAAPIHNIVAFGDSLSDNGNLYELMKHQFPQSPPYFKGRFSNGPVWVEQLAASYFTIPSQHFYDFAIGGAGVSENPDDNALYTLDKEIDTYLQTTNINEDSLYILWIGGNNYLGNPPDPDSAVHEANSGIRHSLQLLADNGAKHILVINLPDLGLTPAAYEFGATKEYSYLANQHNLVFSKTIAQMKTSYPEVDWLFFDTFSLFNDVINNAEQYGFTNVTGTCFLSQDGVAVQPNIYSIGASLKPQAPKDGCEGFLFFDLVHPTEAAHKLMAQKVRAMLDAKGLEFAD